MHKRIQGLIAPAFTPMRDDGTFNPGRVAALVDQAQADGVNGLLVGATTGEGSSLAAGERVELAEAYASAASGRLPVMIDVSHNSLTEAGRLAEHAQQAGVAAITAAPPTFFRPPNANVLVQCMADITLSAPDLPFYYTHIPHRTHVNCDMLQFLRLGAASLPTLAGIIFISPAIAEYQACLEFESGRFHVIYGREEMLLSALGAGASAAVGRTFHFAAGLYRDIIHAFRSGPLSEARRLQGQAATLIRILSAYRGIPACKSVMKMLGLSCGPCRLPLKSLDANEYANLYAELNSIDFFEWSRPAIGMSEVG